MYYTTDANFNVTALVRADTGRVAERYEYDPYGFVTILNGDPGTAVINQDGYHFPHDLAGDPKRNNTKNSNRPD